MKRPHMVFAAAAASALFAGAFVFHSETAASAAAMSNGQSIFETNCSTCHGSNGTGQPGVFPPLAGNKQILVKDPTPIIKIVLNGLNVPKEIEGKQYNGGMPSWKLLKDADIAAVLTYVRNSWGNKAPAVTEKEVAAARK